MAKARLTRVVSFNAAHRYFRPEWSPERNREVFGACANDPGHGHSYQCIVTVTGALDDATAMVIDLTDFDRILQAEVVEPLDHQHLNFAIPEFAYGKTNPTAEALAVYLWRRLAPLLPTGVALHRVRIQEDPTLYADYYGD